MNCRDSFFNRPFLKHFAGKKLKYKEIFVKIIFIIFLISFVIICLITNSREGLRKYFETHIDRINMLLRPD